MVKHEERRERERKTEEKVSDESPRFGHGHDGHDTVLRSFSIRRVLIIPALTDGEACKGAFKRNVVCFNIAKSLAKTRGPKFETTPAPSEGRSFTVNSLGPQQSSKSN